MPRVRHGITGSYVLKNGKNSQGKRMLHLRYFIGKTYVYRSTGIWVFEEEWNQKEQKVIAPEEASPRQKNEVLQTNIDLFNLKTECDRKLENYKGTVTIEVVEKVMDQQPLTDEEKANSLDFCDYAKQVVFTFYQSGKFGISVRENLISNIRVYQRFVEHFLRKYTYNVADIRKEDVLQFIAYRRTVLGNKSNQGIQKSIHVIQMTVKEALENGMMDPNIANAILKISVNSKRTVYSSDVDEDDVKYLTSYELNKVSKFRDTLKDERRRKILDSFFFSVYTGLRFSDVMTLEWSHIQEHEIHKMQVKTKKEVIVPLNQAAMEILDIYRPNETRYVFGYLEDDFDASNPLELQRARNSKNRTVNVSLKTVAEKTGIAPFSFHAARHSFAVLSLESGVDIYMLSQIMGHSATEITSLYAKFLPNSLSKEVKDKLTFSFTSKVKKPNRRKKHQ